MDRTETSGVSDAGSIPARGIEFNIYFFRVSVKI